MDVLIRPWRRFFDFRGRATRTEYVLFHVTGIFAFVAVEFVFVAIARLLTGAKPDDLGPAGDAFFAVMAVGMIVLTITFLIGHFSVAVRRLHDHSEPGLKYLMTFIPVIGFIFWLMLVFTRGDEFENEYGPDPRQPAPLQSRELDEVFS
jgi:uncharacterized membrane protein YhaH (DUF805 family)